MNNEYFAIYIYMLIIMNIMSICCCSFGNIIRINIFCCVIQTIARYHFNQILFLISIILKFRSKNN